MPQVAVNVPFESSEIIEIAKQEFDKRLRGLGPLQGNKEYAGFRLDFQVKLRLRRPGEQPHEARETLAWADLKAGELPSAADLDTLADEEKAKIATADHASAFESGEPNDERIERDMPLTIETGDGKGGKVRKKARMSNNGKKAAKEAAKA